MREIKTFWIKRTEFLEDTFGHSMTRAFDPNLVEVVFYRDYASLFTESGRLKACNLDLHTQVMMEINEHLRSKEALRLALPLLKSYDEPKWRDAAKAVEEALK